MKITWISVGSLLLANVVQAADISSTISFNSEYRLRGISQTAGDAALQGSIDAVFENGVYAGIWGSNVDLGDDANIEVDYYLGYGGNLTDEVSWDATLLIYTFPGYDAKDIDYNELAFKLYYGDLSLQYAYSNDYLNSAEAGHYVSLDYGYALNDDVSLSAHAGHSFGDFWSDLDIGDYSDFSVGVSTQLSGVEISASYLFNDIDSAKKSGSGAFRNDNTLLLSVSRSF